MTPTTVTPAKSVALQHLAPDDLHGQLRDSLTQLSILGRKMSVEIRIRLLPMLQEVKRRYDSGETINRVKGYHKYLRSVGLNPSTVRTWARRKMLLDGIPEGLRDDIIEEFPASSNAKRQANIYERELKDEIEWHAEQFDKKLKEDPEFRRRHEEKQRAAKKEQEEYFEQFRARAAYTKAAGPITKYKPTAKDVEEFISLGRRAAAAKYHPDKGGNAERMAQLNQVADWIEKLAESNQVL